MNYFDKLKKYSIVLFNLAIFSAMVQGAAVTIFALMEKRPPAPHRYYELVSGFNFFYLFSFFKHLFFVGSIGVALVLFSQIFLKQGKEDRKIIVKYLKISSLKYISGLIII